MLGRGKGYLSAAGPQYRFMFFLFFILLFYTFLLRVFQKLAEILQLPLFFSISLVMLLIFIGIVGTLYSHRFVGPMARIKRSLDELAEGNDSLCLRLRESDDPMLKDLSLSICRLAEHNRNAHTLIRDQAHELFSALQELQQSVRNDANKNVIEQCLDRALKSREQLDRTIKSHGKI